MTEVVLLAAVAGSMIAALLVADDERYLIFGIDKQGKHIVVSYTERGDRIRLISARVMTARERRAYER
jgi:uncharacterized DUF497 family protein